jgi:8-amino-7-oxononanoate synthase
MTLLDALRADAMRREAQHLRRHRRVQITRDGAFAQVDGQSLLNFASNDYLGFAQHPAVIAAFCKSVSQLGVGSAGSALVSGYFESHRLLESQAAQLFGYQAALYVGGGYLANIGVLQTLLDANSICVQDKLNHACLIDGALFSGATLQRFPHGDMGAAAQRCAAAKTERLFLVSDGVFSMDGEIASLTELSTIAQQNKATLLIDDAHGVGVLGDSGLGSLQASGLGADEVPILIVPAGKALGGQGALILSSSDIINHLLETARPYVFSTAPAPAMAAAISASLDLLQNEPEHHAALQTNIQQFVALAKQAGLPMLPSRTAIQPLMIGDNSCVLQLAERCRQQGFWLSAIRPPTVPAGKARLRITLTALHTTEHIERLIGLLHNELSNA